MSIASEFCDEASDCRMPVFHMLEPTYVDFKDLKRRAQSDKVREKAYDVAKNPKYAY